MSLKTILFDTDFKKNSDNCFFLEYYVNEDTFEACCGG